MNGIDPAACKFALSKIDDGFVFEQFAQRFLSAVLGHSFLPVGGIKDRGIDGLEHIFARSDSERVIYQCSIEKGPQGKAEGTLIKLKDNQIKYDRFTYVTNQEVSDKDKIIDALIDKYSIPVQIYDLSWFSANVNHSDATINAYQTVIDSYLHEFHKPGGSFVIGDLVDDPRLYVFLRQQWEEKRGQITLDALLADTLILYALEGTDPDKNILKTKPQITQTISQHLKFEPKLLSGQINDRLDALSRKPNKKINYHKQDDAYCLPYETRLELTQKNIKDVALHQKFRDDISIKLKHYLKLEDVKIQDCVELVDGTLNKLFYKQGLEFSDLMRTGHSKEAFEKSLPDTISGVVDESKVILKNKQAVKSSLLFTIRDIVYNGTLEQKQFLKCLSNTYMLLFMLQCDPKVSMFFSSMASKLNVFVDTSILIPALSEYHLELENRRYWNLLVGAKNAGVKLKINENIINELVAHFRKIDTTFQAEYKGNESLFDNEVAISYVGEILLRAYFYSKLRGKTKRFDDFIDNFCTPGFKNAKQELIDWLGHEFGIEFITPMNLDITVNKDELEKLQGALVKSKHDKHKALNDANLILTIFALRDKYKEASADNWAGYKTWWLSSDTVTQKVVNNVFGEKYQVSCYMRPDFLYNYISLAPNPAVVSEVYKEVFPNLLGINISHNVPSEVMETVGEYIREHKSKNTPRLKSILREYSDKLKTDSSYASRAKIKHFFDQELKKVPPLV